MFNSIPKLPKRQNLIEKFSMYMVLETSNRNLSIQWKSEPHLQRNIELYLHRHGHFALFTKNQSNEHDSVQFWLKMALHDLPAREEWEPTNRGQKAWEHLVIYCEESCYKAAVDVWKDDISKSWEEYIFLSRCLIYESIKFKQILHKYDDTESSLDTYMTSVLRNAIKDEASVAKYSKWRLLHQKSDKELKEALEREGRYEPEISRFLFARKYFKQVYQINKIQNPTKRKGQKWQEPDIEDFTEAANYYNAEKLLPSTPHEVSTGTDITGQLLKAWMEVCISALQNYPKSVTPRFSLEALRSTGREFESEDESNIRAENLSQIEEVESSNQTTVRITKLTEPALRSSLLALKVEQQEILLLYYGLGFNQKQIADKFAVTQGAIARRLQTIEVKLLKTIYGLSQPDKWVTQYVGGWLIRNYQAPLSSDLTHVALIEAIRKLEPREQEVLRLTYGQSLSQEFVMNHLNITQPDLIELLEKSKAKLEAALIKGIDNMIHKYLQIWLQDACKSAIKTACDRLKVNSNNIDSLSTIDAVLEASRTIFQFPK